jgi:hypothetical protein
VPTLDDEDELELDEEIDEEIDEDDEEEEVVLVCDPQLEPL